MDAISKKFTDIIELCLANNANVAAVTKDGKTALHYAAASGAVRIEDQLSDTPENLNAADRRG